MSPVTWRDRNATQERLSRAIQSRGRAVIGLTGGIGSGKSTVARLLSDEGFDVIDADRLSREISSPGGRAWSAIVALMGTEDRASWGEKAFRDPELRKKLEGILHPMIREESARRVITARSPIVIYEAALLIEAGRSADFDALVAVVSDPEHQVQRVLARDQRSEEQVRAMIAAQTTNRTREDLADVLVRNDDSLPLLEREVRVLAEDLRKFIPA